MKIKIFVVLLLLTFSAFSVANAYSADVEVMSNVAMDTEFDQSEPDLEWRGLAYGPFRGVGPDRTEFVSIENVQEDMAILEEMGVNHIRTYGIGLGLNQVPFIAAQYNITTATGTWIHQGNPDNEGEIDTALAAESVSSMVIVGNEVLTGKVGIDEDTLVGFVNYAKANRVNESFPIASAEEWLYLRTNSSGTLKRTALGNATDVIIMHAHPAWHNVPLNDAAAWVMDKYNEIADLYPDKRVILGETGWPSDAAPIDGNPAAPQTDLFNEANQKKFIEDMMALIIANDVESYLFEAFDENWKQEIKDGNSLIGPYWGLIEEARYGKPSAVVVADHFGGFISTTPPPPEDPVTTSPDDFQVDVGATASITWTITDADSDSGSYTLYRNDFIQGVADLTWNDGEAITIAVDTSTEGVFTFKIVFDDGRDVEFEDIVVVTVGETPGETSETSDETSDTGGTPGFGLLFAFSGLIALQTVVKRFRKQ
ncbi:MAG: hypothetical protein ACXAE3_05805 [Candidatus Kariarchaeaceae archaeon]